MKNLFNGKRNENPADQAHTDRETKRRLLLNKKYELSETLHNDAHAAETAPAGAGAAEGVLNMTKKRFYAIVAVIVALAVLVTSTIVFVVKGASAAQGTKLDISQATADGNELTWTVGADGMDSGYYNVTYDGRTYVYDLQFDEEGTTLEQTHKLVEGDKVIFNTQTKKITWTYTPSNTSGWVDLSTLCEDPATSGTVTSLELKDSAALVAGTTYYYYDEASGKYYLFEIQDDLIGRKDVDTSTGTGQSDSLPYYYERKIADAELISSNDNPIKVQIDTADEATNITIVGDQLARHQIYMKVSEFTDGYVYLIRNSAGQLISDAEANTGTHVNPSQNGLVDKGSSASNCGYTTTKHTYYNVESKTQSLTSYGQTTYYNTNGNAYATMDDYFDSGASDDTFVLSEFYAKGITHEVKYNLHSIIGIGTGLDSMNVSGFYLFGYDNDDSHSTYNTYTSNKSLGQMFNDDITDIKLYNLCEGTTDITYWAQSRTYNHNDNSLWIYDGGKLTTKYRGDRNNDSTIQTGYLQKKSSDGYELVSSTSDSYELYERTSVYEETSYDGVDQDTVSTDKNYTRTVSPKSITYDETESVDNGLELKKTVTDNGDDTFSVQLEAWTTRDRLDQPDTDIVLVLDTSKNMSNVLYNRNYENLNTYATFTPISLSNVSYNDFHDPSNKHNKNNLINMSNDYANNKYIEDPNNPGMYVYVSSTYELQASFSEPHLYSYSFTDNYGNVYISDPEQIGVSLFGSMSAFGSVGSVKFKLKERATGSPANIKTEFTAYDMYTRTDSNTNYLNSNLYAVSTEGGGPGLYYKHTDGKFYEVHVTKEDKTFQASGLFNNQTVTQPVKYTYTMTIDGVTYTAVQGNDVYGADYGVFQGFRSYVYDSDGDLTLDTTQANLLSKSLYKYTGEDENGNGNTEVTAFQAMKESMEEFLLSSHYQSLTKKSGVNIALVTYDKASTVQYTLDKTASNYTYVNKSVGDQSIDNMICAIYNYSVTDTWASELGDAMATAYNQLNTYSLEGNRRYSALFTAGVPADYTTFWWIDTSDATFDTSVADSAISYANRMKNDLGTTIYTVGLFDNANEKKIYGKYWYYQFLQKVACTGKAGSYWGGSWVANFNYSMDPKDAYATNRMLAYISSDSADVSSLGLTRGRYSPGTSSWLGWLVTRGYGYRINNAYTPEESGYYYGISPNTFDESAETEDASATSLSAKEVNAILTDVFAELKQAMAIPNAVLDEDAYIMDGITKYFQLTDAENVTAHVEDYNTGKTVSTLTPVISEDGKTLSVKGFNYSEHFVGVEQVDATKTAQKVVVNFDITREDDFIGGNDVPTNRPTSGMYDGEGILEETFDVPHADVSIIMDEITVDDANYYGNDEYLPDLLETKWTDGTNNAYVDIVYTFKDGDGKTINTYTIPAGASEGTWDKEIQNDGSNAEYVNYQVLDTTEFTIECEVKPVYSGTVDDKDIKDGDEWYTSTVYVYQPHYDVHNDTVAAAGDKYDLTTVPELSWIGYDTNGDALSGTEKTTADGYLEDKTMPGISYDITKDGTIVTVAAALDEDGEYEYTYTPADYKTDKTAINETTDYTVGNVNVTPAAFTYETVDVVEINYYEVTGSGDEAEVTLLYTYDPQNDVYYDAEGNVADDQEAAKATCDAVAAANVEEVEGIVTKTVNRTAVNASTNEDVTYTNTDDDRTNGEFTIGLNEHQVIIKNHTTGDEGADYSDPAKKFPLELTLTNGNTAVDGETVTYIDTDGTEKELTFTNGKATIQLADSEQVTLKDVKDGYKLTITSNPDDGYQFLAQIGADENNLTELSVDEDTETTAVILVTNDALVDLTHHIGQIVVTGVADSDHHINLGVLIAILAFMAAAGFGVYEFYLVKRIKAKRDGELETFIENINK